MWIPTFLGAIKVSLPMMLADDVFNEVKFFSSIIARNKVSS